MNKDKLKGFFSGLIFAVILGIFALGATALAAPIKSNITVVYDDLKIYVDGVLTQPKDTSGKIIKPFISEGVTYLPVTAISRLLGKDVSWDGETRSIYIGEKPAAAAEVQEVTVSTAEELFAALGSNKHIKLEPGIYNLSTLEQRYTANKNIYWQNEFDGKELVLNEISNLTLEGMGETPAEIVVEPRYVNVLTFLNSSNISLKNIKAGHTPEKGACTGGVLNFASSKDIDISNSILYGCGTYGIIAENTENLKLSRSIIEECTYGAISLNNCKDFSFINSTFRNCKSLTLIDIRSSSNITYLKCNILDNSGLFKDSYIIYPPFSSEIKFTNCKFTNNQSFSFAPDMILTVDFSGSTWDGNRFEDLFNSEK